MSSRHHNSEPHGRWHATIYLQYTSMKDEALTHDGSKDEYTDQVTHNSEHISET